MTSGDYAGMDEPVCPCSPDALRRVAELEAHVAELTRKLEEAMRAGKRQADPFRTGSPRPTLNTLGRKSGDVRGTHGHRTPPPGSATECHRAPQPDACPHCHGPLVGTDTAERFHTEIPRQPPVRKFVVYLGRCTGCGAPAHGRHPLMTSHALGSACQIGPDTPAAVALLHSGQVVVQ
jgi:transposase